MADIPRDPKHTELWIDHTVWKLAVKSKNKSGGVEVPKEALSTKVLVEKGIFDLLQFCGYNLIGTHSKTQLSLSYTHVINDFHYVNIERQVLGLEKQKAVYIVWSVSTAK